MMLTTKASALLSSKITKVPCLCVMKRAVFPECTVRCYNDDKEYRGEFDPKKLKDPDTIVSPSKYRVPFCERDDVWYSRFALFGGKNSSPPKWYRYDPKYFKLSSVKNFFQRAHDYKLKTDQQFSQDRYDTLGADLAAAHFIVYRGGSVKFCGHSEWLKPGEEEDDDRLPKFYDSKFYIEAIDLSGMFIIYEGLENILNLQKLKWLNFKSCPYFDDWCLDRITGAYCDSLEYLDISNTKVTDRGISVLYRTSRLNTLKLHDISVSSSFKLTCLMLEDINPDLKIEGVSHSLESESENINPNIKIEGVSHSLENKVI